MTESLFDIIFRGDILPGHQLLQVKSQLAKLFKADEQKINALFAGGAVALKRNLELAAAEKYQAVLRKAGADVQVAAAGTVKTATPGARKVANQRRVDPAAAAPKMTLKQRLEAAAGSELESAAENEPAVASAPAIAEATKDDHSTAEGELGLSPVGSDLLNQSERREFTAVSVDTSYMSLREPEGNLLDDDEITRVDAVEVDADFELAEVGADILRDSEKRVLPEARVRVPEVDLAPAGSDLGQIPAAEPPPPPDTSKISVEPAP